MSKDRCRFVETYTTCGYIFGYKDLLCTNAYGVNFILPLLLYLTEIGLPCTKTGT